MPWSKHYVITPTLFLSSVGRSIPCKNEQNPKNIRKITTVYAEKTNTRRYNDIGQPFFFLLKDTVSKNSQRPSRNRWICALRNRIAKVADTKTWAAPITSHSSVRHTKRIVISLRYNMINIKIKIVHYLSSFVNCKTIILSINWINYVVIIIIIKQTTINLVDLVR